ncbi:MAG: carboxypeptidase-like regulatory domain-containing protein [Thermoguttaceae bacterium]
MTMKKICCVVVFCTLLSAMQGCGESGPRTKGVVPAAGVLTLSGKPIEGATITFVPSGGEGQPASAMSDSSGRFALGALTPGEGALPGKYQVAVSRKNDVTPLTIEERNRLSDAGKAYKVVYEYIVPQKYERYNASGIEITIPTTGNKEIKLELSE